MPDFSPIITDFWHGYLGRGTVLHTDDDFQLAVYPDLDEDSRLMVLTTVDGKTSVALAPDLCARAGIDGVQTVSEFWESLDKADITMHGADNLFYFNDDARDALVAEVPTGDVRQLTADDKAIFSAFESVASVDDLDNAQVELGHWAVFGSFDNGRLVAVSSIYQWEGAAIMDLGVLTLPIFRGRGHARQLVRAVFRYACARGYEPQYRCQVDNSASSALARAAGLTLFGTLDVIAD
ncbi:GNAT family N-acetyltransferase [Mycobacteroides chelonae]|jgi:RimJ/RimL family protein N-acetyltransferase|uniref:GNAT family N-acetyltransferase n=1 Tax=Mycobacteroides chelonae TaxID=1774 RepID=A0A1S1M5U3_MYCCH|nr:GNAT family N-acetyltransferase [Mycobacteroides chelonae]MBF9352620.1 GNAT family N-acetyltransferase [Mycobacteroides chelonae]MEC4838338.1 GNAT family N-acetyltransferase [Mycobacteroides chelonae]MEC4846056.1 GNAT family N-acetyltransferase [Mycobacteroides chelonae]OHU24498.1 GNAT family N-acetyltransferase [Mycobacteroides chelonae]OHU39478.1 GNAT family N-acetyltransferase [Mycobacteroides chelonae]